MFENTSIAIMYAVTPCHAGSGSALGVVDLPIQRERHTNWPMIQASGVKGAFRANFDRFKNKIANKEQIKDFEKLTESIFGTSFNGGYAGSLSISDAKILAFPMRSNVSPFVWITCPSVLKRLEKDLSVANFNSIEFDSSKFSVSDDKAISLGKSELKGNVLLEDYEVQVADSEIKEFSEIEPFFKDAERLLLVSDDVFNYGVSNCTQIMAQIKIDSKTGTTQDGSLRYQEELPSDTVMYTVIHWGDSKNSVEDKLKAETIKNFITEEVIANHIQIAGDETCGRGVFQLAWNHSSREEM
ncbi:type III-B CRISPR module RAMP protein Cmr4 [Treponema sp. UBA6852]|uniref:type III-B CRISPR module RAMP protein Cmr4 n=1 Tax=Treponema sp. UBA6852 TaxID=1947744 RepID=UPI000E7EBB6F|nr:type III-B CRISPR module RAMP protein Cmr4 [Treponema sp. UBA6852]HBP09074.1 type III-B CRISPR module RAMP protein Cmr4 [Treponema sp.]